MIQPKLIILEGADGVGKTTLGKWLANDLCGFYFHATATKTLVPAMRDYQRNLMDNIMVNAAEGRTMIMDRFWPSELVYGHILRPNNPYGFSYRDLESECRRLNAIYILCFSNTAVVRHHQVKDPKHPYRDRDFLRIYQGYLRLWDRHRRNRSWMRYDLEKWMRNMRDFSRLILNRYNEITHGKSGVVKQPRHRSYSRDLDDSAL